jgi:hypothetical protein
MIPLSPNLDLYLRSYQLFLASRTMPRPGPPPLVEFVGLDCLLAASPAYRQGDWLLKPVEATILHLQSSSEAAATWSEALDNYEGVRSTPIMTIHKSKGLEYHTVVFIGFDDKAWWGYKDERKGETCGFFVVFTRAKQRVIFAYCSSRGSRQEIAPLYALLESAGVKVISK